MLLFGFWDNFLFGAAIVKRRGEEVTFGFFLDLANRLLCVPRRDISDQTCCGPTLLRSVSPASLLKSLLNRQPIVTIVRL